MAKLLDGNSISSQIRAEIKEEVKRRLNPDEKYGAMVARKPACLAVVLCSNDPASEIYVQRKREACAEVGITSRLIRPFEGGIENWQNPQNHLLSIIDHLNNDKSVDGILVQLPLPPELDGTKFMEYKMPSFQYQVFDRIDPLKDVDVFNPVNVGLLLQGRPRFIPCTPQGIQELLIRSNIQIKGKKVCIINRSDVVGKPLHALLVQNNEDANATVTVCHDHTPPDRLKEVCLRSDIIVVAVGKPKFLTEDMVPEGAVVIDVGINRIPGSKKIVGDVDFESVSKKASAISPVPGGVGPMTVTMLLRNVLKAQLL
jgi:methylenetetrahydrofolate dehydrogenase (NADP+)/methenyltetrahydrofolate cyclohydrolase